MMDDEIFNADDNIYASKLIFKNKEFTSLKWKNDGISIGYHDGTELNFNAILQEEAQIVKTIQFIDCKFHGIPIIDNNFVLIVEFENCVFFENITKELFIINGNDKKRVYLSNCKISTLQLGSIESRIYNDNIQLCKFYIVGCSIDDFIIENLGIASKFYINKQYDGNNQTTKIKNLKIENSIFKENFKLHNCEVENVIIKDSDFEKNADFYKSEFVCGLNDDDDKTIFFKALNFRRLALFGETKYHEKVDFKYVTFEGLSHFRGAEFRKGLNLDLTNIEKEMNFFDIQGLDSKDSRANTSQETYRIIKHNFTRLGNTIEANKFHALELGKKRESLESDKPRNWLDYLVFKVHWVSSEHSTNWFLTLGWIFIVGLFTSLLSPLATEKSFFSCLGEVFKHVYILDASIKNPIILLFNKLSLGYLYYQFLTAIRKDTRK